ncbi:MAG TPA: CBS domain-containing protein [Steroidobacteraceae bacterium]|jgi:CBS domain-containing protein
MRISQILRAKRLDVIAVPPDSTIRAAVTLMKEQQVGALVVVDSHGRLLGVLSERDVIHGLASQGADALHQMVRMFMRTDSPMVTVHDTVQSAMQMMTAKRVRHLPVVDGDRMIGVISIGDVVKSRLDEKTQENDVLQDIARLRVVRD